MTPDNCHVSSKYTYINPTNLRPSIWAVSCVPHPLNQPRSQVTGHRAISAHASDVEALHQTWLHTTASPPTSTASTSSRSRLRAVCETDADVTAHNCVHSQAIRAVGHALPIDLGRGPSRVRAVVQGYRRSLS